MSEAPATLRERQAEQVREELRRAFVELTAEKGPDGFVLRDVATTAGVSERTLYRHYANREALVEAVREIEVRALEGQLAEVAAGHREMRRTLFEDPEVMATTFAVFDEHADLIRATRLLRVAGVDTDASYARTEATRTEVTDAGTALDDEGVRQLAALLRLLLSSDAYLRLSEVDLDLDPAEAGRAVQWAAQVLMDAAGETSGALRPRTEGGER